MSEVATRFWLCDERATERFGRLIGRACSDGGFVYLDGDLGAGKTTLTRGVLRVLGHEGAVKSPTYTLVEPYSMLTPPVYHFDLYRLGDPEELEFMGIRDYFDHNDVLTIVEWPQRGAGVLPEPDFRVRLEAREQGRQARLEVFTERGMRMVDSVVSLSEMNEDQA